jgi:hypothetical protein
MLLKMDRIPGRASQARFPDHRADITVPASSGDSGEEALSATIRADEGTASPVRSGLSASDSSSAESRYLVGVSSVVVCCASVGERLDQRRSLALSCGLHGLPGDGEAREHVVAVDPQSRETEPERPLVERDLGLPVKGL